MELICWKRDVWLFEEGEDWGAKEERREVQDDFITNLIGIKWGYWKLWVAERKSGGARRKIHKTNIKIKPWNLKRFDIVRE